VKDLERDTAGAFTQLKNISPKVDVTGLRAATAEANALTRATTGTATASDRAAERIRTLAIQSANALRVSTDQASRLRERLLSVGDTTGLAQLESGLNRLRNSLTNATSGLDVRAARAGYADLASELNRTARESERVRATANAATRAQEEAARAAQSHATELDRLRTKYNPLFAASKQYESALEEINRAESAGALTAQLAAQARTRAAAQLGAASAAADQYSASLQRNTAMTQQGVMVGHQLSDVLIVSQMGFQSVGMIALQQGSQLAAQMNTLKASGGGVFRTLLSGLTSLVNPLSLLTIGAVAVGATIAKWFFAAGEETQSFSDALSDANSKITELRSATDALSGNNLRRLREEYGAVNAELDSHLERLRKVAELEAGMANAAMISSIRGELTSDGNIFTGDVDAVRIAFETTNDRARTLLDLMGQVKSARTFQEQAEAVTRLRQAVESTTGGLDKAEGSAAGVLTQLVRAEDAALRLMAAQEGTTDATGRASGAASNLAFTVGTAADEAARLLANLNSAPAALTAIGRSVQGQIASIQAQNKALNLQISGGLSGAAANRRVQLDTVIAAASNRGQPLTVDQIAPQLAEVAALDAAAKEQKRLQDQLSEANRPARKASGGGGGQKRVETLGDEERQLNRLLKKSALKDVILPPRFEGGSLRLRTPGRV
jgi:DNA repair exonuclease SbcCD ATPase subunit